MSMLLNPYRFGTGSGDPHWANVVLLAGWETGYIDESPVGRTLTFVSGGTSGRSTGDKKFGSWGLFTTNGGHVTAPDSADWNFGSGAFTVETWARRTSSTSQNFLLGQYDTTGNQRCWGLAYTESSNTWQFFASSTGASVTAKLTAVAVLSTTVLQHVCVDFDGTTYRLYLDGVMIASATGVVTMFDSTATMRIGHAGGGLNGWVGWQDEIRITKGVARYASDGGFTVPSAAYPRA